MDCPKCEDGSVLVEYEDLTVLFDVEHVNSDGSIYTADLVDIEWGQAKGPFLYCTNDCEISFDDLEANDV